VTFPSTGGCLVAMICLKGLHTTSLEGMNGLSRALPPVSHPYRYTCVEPHVPPVSSSCCGIGVIGVGDRGLVMVLVTSERGGGVADGCDDVSLSLLMSSFAGASVRGKSPSGLDRSDPMLG
jgi:hypothetical protein